MAHLQQRDPESNGQGDIVRSWDMEPRGFPGSSSGPQSFKEQAEQALDLLQRQKWVIALTCLVVVAGTALYTYTQDPVYSTSSLVAVDKEGSSGTGIESEGLGLLSGGDNALENELIFLRNSQSLQTSVAKRLIRQGKAKRVLKSQDTSAVEGGSSRAMGAVQRFFGIADGPPSGGDSATPSGPDGTKISVGRVASGLAGRVQFERASKKANVIQITIQDENPEIARLLAQLYTEEYIAFTRESSRKKVTASRKFLQERAQELEEELETTEEEIEQYQRREDAISLDQREGSLTNRIAATKSELEQARIELQMEKSSLKSLREELNSIRPEQLSERVSSTVAEEIELLQSRTAELESSKQQLQLQAGTPTAADSAQVAQIDRRLQKLRSRISRLSDKYVGEIMAQGLGAEQGAQRVEDLKRRTAEKKIKISGLESRISAMSERLQEYRSELNTIPEKSMELAQLKRDQEYSARMYKYITEQLQKTRVREKSELGYASKVAKATLPTTPVSPRPQRNLFLSLIMGLLGGAALALVRDQMDNRIYKPDQIREMGYHEVGIIPNLAPLVEDQLDGQATVDWNGRQVESNLVGGLKPYSAAAESYRKVWTNLQLGQPDEANDVVLITSPGSGDGKSLTAANLATVSAEAGQSTLLIDGDVRRPRLHKIFDISRAPGVTEALQDGLEEDEMKRPLVENLCLLPAGTEVKNPAKLLGSSQFRNFLQRAQQHFDRIIVDSSPVLATADGPLLSQYCDMTLCVVRAGTTTEPELDDAIGVLNNVGANLAGVVFNGFDISMAYGYKYRYRHYDQYGPYDQYRSLPEEASV